MALKDFTLAQIAAISKNTLDEHFGIEITEIGEDYLCGKMPVTNRNVQPFRQLHGGASVAFAESLGSLMAIMLLPDTTTHTAVGIEINANHLRSVKEGKWVFGRCIPLHVGRTSIICEIKIINDEGKLVCASRITLAVVPINQKIF
jgi:1,4-dihydroxy-2-naphthoyl-CoA hydrolase